MSQQGEASNEIRLSHGVMEGTGRRCGGRLYGTRRSCRAVERIGPSSKIRPRQSTSAVVLGKFMSVEGIARVTLRQTGEQAAGLGLVLVAER